MIAPSSDVDRTESRRDPAARTEQLVWVALGAVVLSVLLVGLWSLVRSRGSDALPILGSVPEFQLVERSGRVVSGADLAGHPWVANFIFTSCAGVCPSLSASMARLRETLRGSAPEVRSVSFSVDPARDTPAVLQEYAKRYGADENGWLFLTGDRGTLHRLIQDGFRLSIAERSPEEDAGAGELITHSDRFVLIDARSQIRGYYRLSEPDGMPKLVHDVQALAAEK